MPKPTKKSLGGRLRKSAKKQEPGDPVWKGPEDESDRGGITQSMLSDFIVCRERFRLRVVEGLAPAPSFNHRIEYGSMWHVCEEALAQQTQAERRVFNWEAALKRYASGLCQKYQTSQQQIQHWYNVCRTQFPIYVDYWAKHQDVKERTPLLQEQTFHVPYVLPIGRTVYLRGKWDSVDLIGKGKAAGVYLQENKTKGDINEDQLKRQLASGFDLQTMFYLVALGCNEVPRVVSTSGKLSGVRYNVVRRPLSGGKYSISQYKPSKSNPQGETDEEFYTRLGGLIREDPTFFFMRWKVEVSPRDIERFRRQCLDPLLEQLCRWWDHVTGQGLTLDWCMHWRTPYGLYNVLAEGGNADVDEYLNTGSEVGLVRGSPLFTELV